MVEVQAQNTSILNESSLIEDSPDYIRKHLKESGYNSPYNDDVQMLNGNLGIFGATKPKVESFR
jgi:hypothetical protein